MLLARRLGSRGRALAGSSAALYHCRSGLTAQYDLAYRDTGRQIS